MVQSILDTIPRIPTSQTGLLVGAAWMLPIIGIKNRDAPKSEEFG